MIQLYHNPRCGKSRNCLIYIEKSRQDYEIIKYLEHNITFEEMVSLLKKLNMKPIQLVRSKEKIWIENFKSKLLSDDQIIQAMINHPILIERPIMIKGDKAIIGREIDKIEAFI